MHRYRSHTCGALRASDIGSIARLSGWCHRIRDHGGVLFIDLRDHYGMTQIVVDPDSPAFRAAEKAGLRIACEIYADRSYTDQGELTPRSQPGAVIHDPAQSLDQVLEMVVNGRIPTTGGKRLPVTPETLCIHGDTKGAVDIARRLRGALEANGVTIAPFAKP